MTLAAVVARLRALPARTRVVLALLAFVVVAVSVGGTYATHDGRVALFATPLRPEQLAEVERHLAAAGTPYVPSIDNVRVDRARRPQILLELALAGAPHPHLAGSEETLAKVGALTPQPVLEAQARDALAADLALGLRGLTGVADARVVIAPASGGVFADEARHDGSASVRITLAPGARLAPRTVDGIRAFVAGGVAGLDAARVTVLDDRGLAFDGPNDDGGDVQAALQSALDGAYGNGATIVRVRREAVGERRDVHEVRRRALDGAIARTTQDERYASKLKQYSKSNATEDRGSDVRDERRRVEPDATARLSVAVFVDASRAFDLEKIRELAAATVGLRAERGDRIAVQAIPFAGAVARPAASSAVWLPWLASVIPPIVVAIAIAVAAAMLARPLTHAISRIAESSALRRTVRASAGLPPARLRGALVGEPPHVAAAIISALPAATAAAVLELYPAEERAQIVRRLGTAPSSLIPAPEELLRA